MPTLPVVDISATRDGLSPSPNLFNLSSNATLTSPPVGTSWDLMWEKAMESGTDNYYKQEWQRIQVHEIAVAAASLSLMAAVLSLYWFCMMRKNFRRTLVMLLIMGDFWKNLWYLAFSAESFVVWRVIPTQSAFCQAGGYLLQTGILACDYAVLFMSLHMYFQIFPSTRFRRFGQDGLYRVRYWVYGLWFCLPLIVASLAYTNPWTSAYIYQAAFCTLPYRPFVYRLVLNWVPRYLIMILAVGVALRIYFHVRKEFKVFGAQDDQRQSSFFGEDYTIGSTMRSAVTAPRSHLGRTVSENSIPRFSIVSRTGTLADEDIAPEETVRPAVRRTQSGTQVADGRTVINTRSRRISVPPWGQTSVGTATNPAPEGAQGDPGLQKVDQNEIDNIGNPPETKEQGFHRRLSSVTFGSQSFISLGTDAAATLPTIEEGFPDPNAPATKVFLSSRSNRSRSSDNGMKARRRAILRQLRMLFIYPLAYVCMWTIPFAQHCMNYSNYWVRHPIYPLGAASIFCQTFLGFIDVLIFCWREEPWKHIPGSDGTFLGSFKMWNVFKTPEWQAVQRMSFAPASPADERTSGKKPRSSAARLLGSFKSSIFPRKGSATTSSSTAAPAITVTETSSAAGAPRVQRPSLSRSNTSTVSFRRAGGGSDRTRAAADRAYERLALERHEYEKRKSRDSAAASVASPPRTSNVGSEKNWFDRTLSIGIGADDDGDEKSSGKSQADDTASVKTTDGAPDTTSYGTEG